MSNEKQIEYMVHQLDDLMKNINGLKTYLKELRRMDWNEYTLKKLKVIHGKLMQVKKTWSEFGEIFDILNDFNDFFKEK